MTQVTNDGVITLTQKDSVQRLVVSPNMTLLKGDKGDAFTYEDFTDEQLEALRGPAGASSWNALIDKPFGLRTTKTVAELQMATGNETILSVSNPATVDVGDVMYVTFDGVKYATTVYILRANEVNTMYAVGNGYIRHQPDFEQNYIGTDTMPFLVAFFLNDDKHRLFCYTQNPDAVHTIGVSMPSDPYVATLDAKYIPDISWDKLTDKPFGVVTNYLQKNITEHEVSASTTSGTVKVSGLGVLTEDRRRYIHEYHAVNLYLNGVLYKSGMVKQLDDSSYKIFASDGEEMSNYLRLDRTTGVYYANVFIPPLEEDTIVTVTYEYDAEFTTIDPNFLPDSVKGGTLVVNLTGYGEEVLNKESGNSSWVSMWVTLDRTYEEIKTAIDSGLSVIVKSGYFEEGEGEASFLPLMKVIVNMDGTIYEFESVRTENDFDLVSERIQVRQDENPLLVYTHISHS